MATATRSPTSTATSRKRGDAAARVTTRAAAKPATASVKAKAKKANPGGNLDAMFELAADTFRVMSAPMRLKIINCLCNEEKNVGQLLAEIDTTQPNMSQHLNTLYKAKILGRRREGVQIYYRIINDRVVSLCRAVCTQIAIDSDLPHA
jgi:DNA-binding transcriptional ArsR family regulator